ncbi:hypothetical protein J6G99_09025 [bacterium]|nr:hypothetical protein [bacterium]
MTDKVEVFNPANKAMHYGDYKVGVLNPPNKIPQISTLSSYKESQEKYNRIQQDLYISQKKAKPMEKRGFPLILKIMGAILIIAGVLKFGLKKLKT